MKTSYQIMPLMTDEQYEELKADIRRNGVLAPIEYDQHGNIIDGHHRMRVILELAQEGHEVDVPPAITRNYSTEEDKFRHIIALNAKRRQLTPAQRQQLVVTLRKRGLTMSAIADMLHISTTTVYYDLEGLSEQDKAELKAAVTTIKGADGAVRTATYVPRINYMSGHAQLREAAQKAVLKAAESVKQVGLARSGTEVLVPLSDYEGTSEAVTIEQNVTKHSNGEVTQSVPVVVVATPINNDDAHKRISAFAWYGGKSSHLTWLLPLLPPTKHFVDVFGGSAAVLMNRDPSPIETYNDIDNGVVNFFRVVREQPDELARLLHLTPYSREERRQAFEAIRKDAPTTPIEKARQFFVLARQTRGESQRRDDAVLNSWKFTRDRVIRGMAGYQSQWETGIDGLAAVAARMRRVQIENYPWPRILELYDTPETLFYCDPPYLHDTREYTHTNSYTHEMSADDHRKLADALHRCKGLVALSGYPSNLYDELYSGWHRVDMPVTSFAAAGANNERIECLWTNYPTTKES